MPVPIAPGESLPRSAWISLAIGTTTAFLVTVDATVVNVAFPSIAEDLRAGPTGLSWIVSGYAVALASFLLLTGRLADRFGRKRVFLVGLGLFVVASLFCGLAPTTGLLVAGRVLQATGGAVLLAVSLALVLPQFPADRRAMAVGYWGAMGSLGAAFGPSIGAVVIEAFGWRAIFLLNVPTGVLIFALAWWHFAESSDPAARGERLDMIGVPLGTFGVAMLMVAMVQGGDWGYASTRTLAFVVVGVVLLPLLIWRSMTHPRPLLDLELFRVRSFSSSTAAFFLYSLGFVSGFLLNSLLMQRLWGYSVLETGFGLTPGPLLAALVSAPAGRFADRYGHRWLVTTGCAACATGYVLLLVRIDADPSYARVFLPANILVGVGIGLSIASLTSAALSDISPQRFAVGNATVQTVRQVGAAFGIAAVAALFGDRSGEAALTGYERGYVWVILAFAAAAIAMMASFPAGSATTRRRPRCAPRPRAAAADLHASSRPASPTSSPGLSRRTLTRQRNQHERGAGHTTRLCDGPYSWGGVIMQMKVAVFFVGFATS